MKNFNIIKLLLALMVFGFLATGCKQSFLEKPKGGAVTTDTIFHTKNQAQYAIAQMYYLCVKSYFPVSSDGCRPEALTDQLYILNPAYSWAAGSINGGIYATGNMGANSNCDNKFGQSATTSFGLHYKGIRQANLIIKNINAVADADNTWKRDVIGQALFCRALQHFEAFRYYGGIPLVNKPLDGDGQLVIPRSSIQSVVDSIVRWCDQAAGLLPATRPTIDYGKVTKLGALALKSRILLYAASPLYNTPPAMKSVIAPARYGDERDTVLCYPTYDKERWNRAAKAAKDVLDNASEASISLYSTGNAVTTGETYATIGDYESMYNVNANPELILVSTRTMVPTASGFGDGSSWAQYLYSKVRLAQWGVKNNVPIEFMQQYEKRDGTKWTLPATGNDLPADITALNIDPRFAQTIAYDGMRYNTTRGTLSYYKKGDYTADGTLASSDAGVDGYAMEAFKFTGRIDGMNDNHFAWIVFRLGEFYLNYAEALNEYQGPGGDATTYLNIIRQRAGMPAKNIASTDAFRDAVQNERSVELAYEGHRYNDLNRWIRAHVVLNTTLHGIETTARNVSGSLKRTWRQVPFIQRVYPMKYYYVPFPNGEVSKAYLGKGTTWDGQNPGW